MYEDMMSIKVGNLQLAQTKLRTIKNFQQIEQKY